MNNVSKWMMGEKKRGWGEKKRGGEERRCNYPPAAEHTSAGLCWNRDEPRADSFYDFISCTDPSFVTKRGIAAHTDTPSLKHTH